MKKIMLNSNEYELVKNYKEVFNIEELEEKYTEYFDDYDYILGDYAYSKLRLKGFYDKTNKNVKEINNYDNVEDYINNYCSYGCGYFIIKKVSK